MGRSVHILRLRIHTDAAKTMHSLAGRFTSWQSHRLMNSAALGTNGIYPPVHGAFIFEY